MEVKDKQTYYEYLLTLSKEKLTEILKSVESAKESAENFNKREL